MTIENEGKATGGSRMKALQEDGGAQQPAAAKAPAAPRGSGTRKAAPAAPPEIDYDKLAKALAPMLALQMQAPIIRSGGISNEGMGIQQMPDIMLGDGTLATGGIALAAIDKPLNSNYVSELAFMEEDMVITVHETEDQNAENPIIVGNNGTFKVFFRGVPTVAKRKFVDGLIVKSTRVTTPEILNAAGERTNIIKQHSAHKYSFTVDRDPSPKGKEWLMRRMMEAV